ncbi:MAG: nucleotide exchange factor GrpE [Planctomycetota bacterium]
MKKKPEEPKEQQPAIPSEEAAPEMPGIPPKSPRPGSGQAAQKDATQAQSQAEGAKAGEAPPEDPAQALEKLRKEIEDLRNAAQERNEFKNLAQRVQADFENYQKRIRRDRDCWEKYKDEDLLKALIPAFDNLDRALKIECKSDDAKCLLDGVGLSKQEIFRIMEKHGVKQIKTMGEKFDPIYHEVINAKESPDKPDNVIIEEVARGFMLFDRVIRPAKVVITANKKKEPETSKTQAPPTC